MSDSKIQPKSIELRCEKKHRDLIASLTSETRWDKEADLGVGDQVVASTHGSRTILELVQNARDAISNGSDENGSVAVVVGPKSLLIANTGSPFELHTKKVFKAVTGIGRSSKGGDQESIGEKGVGLKSLLQLSERFSIRSIVDEQLLQAEFSRARTGRMLLRAYRDLSAAESDPIENYRGVFDKALDDQPNEDLIPSYIDFGEIWESNSTEDKPIPEQILVDLPRVSLFRYPFAGKQALESRTGMERVAESLIEQSSSKPAESELSDSLTEWLSERKNQYQTVIELEYADSEWTSLLDEIQDELAKRDLDGLEEFAANRQSSDGSLERKRQKSQNEFWDECTELAPATLILLGHLQEIDFLKVEQDEGGLEIEQRRKVQIRKPDNEEQLETDGAPPITRTPINVSDGGGSLTDEPESETVFRRYSRPLDPERYDELEEDDSTVPKMQLLFEKPEPASLDWTPTTKPLHLYYPISEAKTSFPFVIHAPFQVTFDRQQLTDHSDNETLLNRIPEFVPRVARDLVNSNGDARNPYRQWMPWLLMPLQATDEQLPGIIQGPIEKTCAQLQETAIVPTDSGHSRLPTELLVDPVRLDAFEVLREYDAEISAPIPAKDVIETGLKWRNRATGTDQLGTERFRTQASRLGLTAVIDQPFHDGEDKLGCVDLLCDYWGVSPDNDDNKSVQYENHVQVSRPKHAEAYFASIGNALNNNWSNHDKQEITPAEKLGKHKVPLLPAEGHDESKQDIDDRFHLVRAMSQRSGDGSQYQRSERIVFRRAKNADSETKELVDLPVPPETLSVYVIPFRADWSGILEDHYLEWGTRELGGPSGFYRRIAAEAGGHSGTTHKEKEVTGYLMQLYHEVRDRRESEWLKPIPYHNRRFDAIDSLLSGKNLKRSLSDYTSYLEQRYVHRIPVPTDDGTHAPAEAVTFGPEWVTEFFTVADALEGKAATRNTSSSDESGAEKEQADQLRRWGAAVKRSADAGAGATAHLAPPSDNRWTVISEHVGVSDLDQRCRRLNFLLHLGVQPGPHIDWGFLFPGRAESERDVGGITFGEVQDFAAGMPIEDDESPIDPPEQLLSRYSEVCWRSENHPAFTVNHSPACKDKWLKCDLSEWVQNNSVGVATWWYFTQLGDVREPDQLRAFRDSVLLLWPEFSDSLLDTAWYCDRGKDSPSEYEHPIPSLGLIQLRQAALWPVEEMNPEGDSDASFVDIEEEKLHPAWYLISTTRSKGGDAAAYLPRLKTEVLESKITVKHDLTVSTPVDGHSVSDRLGSAALDELSPGAAAERLKWFIETRFRHPTEDTPDHTGLQKVDSSWMRAENSRPVYGLMRRLVSNKHLKHKISDQNKHRKWQRRDLWWTGTKFPVTHNSDAGHLEVGNSSNPFDEPEIRIYTENLPQYARGIVAKEGAAIIERPPQQAADLAAVIGDDDDEADSDVWFGIRRKTKIPPIPIIGGTSKASPEEEEKIGRLQAELDSKCRYLLAAYLRNSRSEQLEKTYEKLSETIHNEIGIVDKIQSGDLRDRRSVQWNPASNTDGEPRQIAIVRGAIETDVTDSPREIPAYLAADGLAQVLGSTDLREPFENVLLKNESALERDYSSQLSKVDQNIEAFVEQRLARVSARLQSLVAALPNTSELPELQWENDQMELTPLIEIISTGVTESTVENPVVEAWIDNLQTVGLSESDAFSCMEAAVSGDPGVTIEKISGLEQPVDEIDFETLVDAEHWNGIDRWPTDAEAVALRNYLAAVARVEEFSATIEEGSRDGVQPSRLIDMAVDQAQKRTESVYPYTDSGDHFPVGVSLPDGLDSAPLVALAYHEEHSSIPGEVTEKIIEWWEHQESNLRNGVLEDILTENEDGSELLSELSTALKTPREASEAVTNAFEQYLSENQPSTSRERRRQRNEQTDKWIANTHTEIKTVAQSGLKSQEPQTNGSSPSIQETSGRRVGPNNIEANDARGRAAELICLNNAFAEFLNRGHKQRHTILEHLQEWRNHPEWRMKSIQSIADNIEFGVPDGDADELLDVLRPEEVEDTLETRRVFHCLFDTSAEPGPGFDIIDPFAGVSDEDGRQSEWQPSYMRRIEVKSVKGTHIVNGRVKLTGNEFRMARRQGPHKGMTEEDTKTDRYHLRLVGFPSDWDPEEGSDEQPSTWDIKDFVEFAKFDSSEEPLWEKLRGGEFYVGFGTEE